MKGAEVIQCISVTLWVISFHIFYIFDIFCSCHRRNKWSHEDVHVFPCSVLPMEIGFCPCFVAFCCVFHCTVVDCLKEPYNNINSNQQ